MFSPLDVRIGAAPGIGLLAAAPWWIPAVLFFSGAPHHGWLTVPAIGCACASILAFCREGLLFGPKALTRIEVRKGDLYMRTNSGSQFRARIAPESRIAHRWLWLRVNDGRSDHTLLLSDRPGFRNTDPISLRRLTVWLRYGQPGRNDTQRPAFR